MLEKNMFHVNNGLLAKSKMDIVGTRFHIFVLNQDQSQNNLIGYKMKKQ